MEQLKNYCCIQVTFDLVAPSIVRVVMNPLSMLRSRCQRLEQLHPSTGTVVKSALLIIIQGMTIVTRDGPRVKSVQGRTLPDVQTGRASVLLVLVVVPHSYY